MFQDLEIKFTLYWKFRFRLYFGQRWEFSCPFDYHCKLFLQVLSPLSDFQTPQFLSFHIQQVSDNINKNLL